MRVENRYPKVHLANYDKCDQCRLNECVTCDETSMYYLNNIQKRTVKCALGRRGVCVCVSGGGGAETSDSECYDAKCTSLQMHVPVPEMGTVNVRFYAVIPQ